MRFENFEISQNGFFAAPSGERNVPMNHNINDQAYNPEVIKSSAYSISLLSIIPIFGIISAIGLYTTHFNNLRVIAPFMFYFLFSILYTFPIYFSNSALRKYMMTQIRFW